MNKHIFVLAITLLAGVSVAQQNVHLPVPTKSPDVTADGTVVFKIKAPKAEKVMVRGSAFEREPSSRQKNDEGLWIIRYDSLAPDLYDYWFDIDGVRTLDPSNPYVARDIATLSNIFIINGGDAEYYENKDVPHGKVEKVWYTSSVLGGSRRMTVYTPPDYGQSDDSYPVLYLLHGMGGDEEAWTELGRAIQILDNQIAAGLALPMIMVMPNGNAQRQAAPGFTADGMYIPEGNHSIDPNHIFEKSFTEIIDFIEDNYRVKRNASSRAIAGLSMGGGHSWRISMNNPGMFDYIGLFSPAVRWNGEGIDEKESDMELVGLLQKQFGLEPKLYLIAIGKDDFLYDLNTNYRKLLDSNGFPYVYIESEGGHTWTNWRHYLADFLPQLFK